MLSISYYNIQEKEEVREVKSKENIKLLWRTEQRYSGKRWIIKRVHVQVDPGHDEFNILGLNYL